MTNPQLLFKVDFIFGVQRPVTRMLTQVPSIGDTVVFDDMDFEVVKVKWDIRDPRTTENKGYQVPVSVQCEYIKTN